ncbi:MAG: DUF502 domain-containing protein [Alphaproteobacteria bacterium]|nr:DUF502 domain-containing protein [Alphaproteobacteria bacterium]
MQMEPKRRFTFGIRGNLVAGVLTIFPLIAVWFIFDLLFSLLSSTGKPLIVGMAAWIRPESPEIADFLLTPYVFSAIAALVVLILLYLIGLLATFVVGQQMIAWIESLIARIPLVQTIYASTKQLVVAFQTKPTDAERVVLIEFPHAHARAIGLVTRTFMDPETGEQLAAVYVPTTPNPTSGYLEIVPVDRLVPTNLTMEEAMAMVISGGTVSPTRLAFGRVQQPEAAQ